MCQHPLLMPTKSLSALDPLNDLKIDPPVTPLLNAALGVLTGDT